MLLQQSWLSNNREMNQLTQPWPFATCRIYGVMGSLCAGLCAVRLQVSSTGAKSNFRMLLLYPAPVITQRGRGGPASLNIHQDKKKTLVLIGYRMVVFHLSKCDNPGCWSFFRQKRQKPKYSIIPCNLQWSQNKLYGNDKSHRPWSSQVISSALTSCYKVFLTFFWYIFRLPPTCGCL